MALLLPQCAAPESLHQLASIRRRLAVHRSCKSARATHGATESSSTTKASTDHFKIPSTEPCCNLISPLVMTPRKPARRSSRLRVRRGVREDAKTDTATDMDAAEWISRVLANNGVVEVDPVTMAEQMQYQTNSNSHPHYYSENYTSSSEASDMYPPRSPGFPSRVPLGVALAAGAAVALATVAFLIQALHRESDETISNSSDSEGNNLASSFKGEPVTPDHSSKGSHAPPRRTRDNKEVLASTVAAGAAVFQPGNWTGRSTVPSPPSLSKTGSKGEKPRPQSKYVSVTPFFASDRSTVSYSRPPPPPVTRWREDKYKSVRPFFPDEVAAATETVSPFFPVDQGSKKKSENGSSSNKTVTSFFADEQQGSKNAKGSASLESVPPFFAGEQQGSRNTKGSASLVNVRPFFADEQQGSKNAKGSASFESVPPFFADEQQGSKNTKGSASFESVPPFFADEQQGSKNAKGSASFESVPPFFADEQQGSENAKGSASFESVPPFFADEQQGSENAKGSASFESVPPFFADEQQGSENAKGSASFESVPPFFADEQQGSKNTKGLASFESVRPFFADEQQSRNGPSLENVTPYFSDEQQGRSSAGVSQSKGTFDLEIVKPFFPDDQVGRSSGSRSSRQLSNGSRPSQFWHGESSSGAQRDFSAESPKVADLRGRAPVKSSDLMLADMAGKSQGQHKEFMEGTAEERLASDMSGAHSFQGGEVASEMALALSPEDLALLEEMKAEEERRYAKMQALQAAFPALAIGAGAVGALVGVDGAFEMVGLTATASFISYELLWANKRQELLDEMSRITDHHKLFNFLQKRKIVKDDC